jgi:DNA polymerase III alpha subunit (gram-positive type)
VKDNAFCVYKAETTGLSTKKDQIVLVAMAQVDCGTPRWQTVCKIKPSVPIKDRPREIHGISDEMLVHSASFGAVAEELRSFIDGRCLVGCGIAGFHLPILRAEYDRAGVPFAALKFIDISLWAKHYTGERYGLPDLARYLNLPAPDPKDSMASCKSIWLVFMGLLRAYPEFGAMSLEQVLEQQETL